MLASRYGPFRDDLTQEAYSFVLIRVIRGKILILESSVHLDV